MNNKQAYLELYTIIEHLGPVEVVKRLAGVQGPEQPLVGESRSATQPDAAEDRRSRESAGVGEIGGASELRGYVERKMKEAQALAVECYDAGDGDEAEYFNGKYNALAELLPMLPVTDTERSDLSNREL